MEAEQLQALVCVYAPRGHVRTYRLCLRCLETTRSGWAHASFERMEKREESQLLPIRLEAPPAASQKPHSSSQTGPLLQDAFGPQAPSTQAVTTASWIAIPDWFKAAPLQAILWGSSAPRIPEETSRSCRTLRLGWMGP